MLPPARMPAERLTGDVVGADHVDVDDAHEGALDLVAAAEHGRDQLEAGIVDEHVQRPEAADHPAHRLAVGDVADLRADRTPALPADRRAGLVDVGRARQDREVGAGAREGSGHRAADAVAGPGDEDPLGR